MKQRLLSMAVVVVSLSVAGIVLAADATPKKTPAEEKKLQPVTKKKEPMPGARKLKAASGGMATGNTTQEAGKASASRSKKQHDTVEKIIDNMK